MPKSAARHEDESLAAIGKLVRELQRNPSTERVTHDGCPLVAEHGKEIAQQIRVGTERVVASGFALSP